MQEEMSMSFIHSLFMPEIFAMYTFLIRYVSLFLFYEKVPFICSMMNFNGFEVD